MFPIQWTTSDARRGFRSAEAQKKAWQAFRADPEWIKVKADSEKDGALVNKVDSTNLKATDYSALR